jgi:hypothetical protein
MTQKKRPKFLSMHKYLLLGIWLLLPCCLRAQEPTVFLPAAGAGDTLPPVVGRKNAWNHFWTDQYPNPRKAILLSFALPGAGQAYNKKWWKIPIVYGALGALTWLEVDNIRQYRALRDNYKFLVDGDPATNPTEQPYTSLDATQMRFYRDQYRRFVELTSVGLGLVYVLAATDAFVDAHLASFDVSDDLSLRMRPRFEQGPGLAPVLGLGISLQIGDGQRLPRYPWTAP